MDNRMDGNVPLTTCIALVPHNQECDLRILYPNNINKLIVY